MGILYGHRLMRMGDSMEQIWDNSMKEMSYLEGRAKKNWMSHFLCMLWMLWRRRNEKIFRGNDLLLEILCTRIKQEGDLWIKFCEGGKHVANLNRVDA